MNVRMRFAIGLGVLGFGLFPAQAAPPAPPAFPAATQVPDMAVKSSHSDPFTKGQTGATYSVTVSNVGSGPSNGTVTVEDTVPTGLSATGFVGDGWSCKIGIGAPNCSRSDVLAAGAAYPVITLTVNVGNSAQSSVTNVVVVSGGGETNTGNDTDSDLTTINPASGATSR